MWMIAFDGMAMLQELLKNLNDRAGKSTEITSAENSLWLIGYAFVCLFSQLLIIPSGSLILIAAGFIFSPLIATIIFSVAQVLCSWPVYRMGELIGEKFPQRFEVLTSKFSLPPNWHKLVQQEGFIATVVLRLTPVVPSAAACLLAAGMNIGLKRFIPATIAVCWIRPLFFASLGGSLQALTGLSEVSASAAIAPLLLLFIAALLLLVVKLYLRRLSAV